MLTIETSLLSCSLPISSAGHGDCPNHRMHLTPRQLQVLSLLTEGLTDRGVARRLDLSIGTVRQHVIDARNKLNALNRVHAVAICYHNGLLPIKKGAP